MPIIFTLRNDLKYQNSHGVSGNIAHDVELIAPSYEQRIYSRDLKQIVQAAIKTVSQSDDLYRVKMLSACHDAIQDTDEFKKQTAEPSPPTTALDKRRDEEADIEWMRKTLLEGVPKGEYSQALEGFSENARFLVKVDDGVFLTNALIKQVDETELEEIFASYCFNFIVPCLQ